MIDDLPDAPDPASDIPSVFNAKAAAMVLAMKAMVVQFKAAIASLNSWLAGGAYAIPYTFRTSLAGAPIPAGDLRLNLDNQTAATVIASSITNAAGQNVTSLLDSFAGSTSAIKGFVKIQKVSDPSKWLMFAVSGLNPDTGSRYVNVTYAGASNSGDAHPFADGDAVMLYFQRTGDKGDPGSSQAVKFSDRKASGTAGGTPVANDATAVRILNTTDYNTIPSGVSLSGNQFTLPAGTYDFFGRAPAYSVGAHKATLYNVTDGQIALVGSSAYSNTSTAQTDSVFSGRLTLASAKTFAVRHYVASAGSGSYGTATAVAGQVEAYTEVTVIKAI